MFIFHGNRHSAVRSCNPNLAIPCAASSKKGKSSRRFAHFLTRFLSRPTASNIRSLHLNSKSSTGIHQTTGECCDHRMCIPWMECIELIKFEFVFECGGVWTTLAIGERRQCINQSRGIKRSCHQYNVKNCSAH